MSLISLLLATALISILPVASEAADVTLAWDSNVEEDISGYHVAYGQASGNYTAVVDVGNTTSHRLFNLDSNRTYFFAVRAYNFKGMTSGFSLEVSTTTVGPPLVLTSVSINQSSPKPVGTQVVFAANAAGGVPPYQYKWFVGDTQSSTMMRDWSADAALLWTPKLAGNYQITAWVRNGNTTTNAPANGSSSLIVPFTIAAPAAPAEVRPLTLAAPRANLQSPQRVGTTIQFTAQADGGVSPIQFRWLVSSGQGWQVHQDWSTSSSFTYTPTAPGGFWISPQVRSATNTTDDMEAQQVMLMTILPSTIAAPAAPAEVRPLTLAAPRANLQSPQRVGTTIQFTAQADGGVSPIQFRWLVSSGQGWQVQQDWSTSSSFTYTPTVPGGFWIRPQVRSATNTTDDMEAQQVMLMTILP